MEQNFNASLFSNPMMLMTDLGLRALDMTVSSSSNLCDGVDRLARAAARPQSGQATPWSFPVAKPAAPAATPAKASSLDPVTQAWVQWIATMGAVASLGAGRGFTPAAAAEPAADTGAVPRVGTQASAAPQAPTQAAPAAGRRVSKEQTTLEHALAAGEARRRSGSRRSKSR
jgi:hypothetical protein